MSQPPAPIADAGRVLRDQLARWMLYLVAAMAAFMALGAGGVMAYGWNYGATIYGGVRAAGVDVGGLAQPEAERRIAERIAASAPTHVTFVAGGAETQVSLDELGVSLDATATAQRAYTYGRTGNLWTDSGAWLASLVKGHEVPLVVHVDEAAMRAKLQKIAPSVTRQPQNARYRFNEDHKLIIDPGSNGIGIDAPATMGRLRESLSEFSREPVPVATVEISPSVTATDLEPGLAMATEVVSAPLTLEYQGWEWQIGPDVLSNLLTIHAPGAGETPLVTVAPESLSGYIEALSDQIKQPGENAGAEWDGNKFVVDHASDGETLDVEATVKAAIGALVEGKHTITIRTQPSPPAISDADAEKAIERAEAFIARPLTLTWPQGTVELAPEQIAGALRFTERPEGDPKLEVTITPDSLTGVLDSVAAQVEVPAKNADLRYRDGAVVVAATEQFGIELDQAQSAAAIRDALLSGESTAALATKEVAPQITADMASSIVIREKLASGKTYYGGSVPNRRHNVDLAVERADGALIPPGGVFSFTGTVGEVNLETGYKVGYGIVGTSNGSVSTVPSVGGGICQVSTTLFHAAFWAGMPIVERNWHLYWIPLYGQQPSGLKGLDATVDTDYGLDLKFKNTTDDWLAVVGTADGEWVQFELWGTEPGWTVEVDDPAVTNVVKADTTMQYQETPTLPSGTQVYVEHAEDGFDVSIHRRVLVGGKVIDDLTLRSHYRPSANVTLVGTG